jgi:subtilisin family serine protease
MRLASLYLVGFLLLGTAAGAQPAAQATVPPEPPARIVLAFANPVLGAQAPAGSSTPGYGGGSYQLGQNAHALAKRVARQYALKEVASWPIQALAVHCVLYEVPAGEDVPALLTRLSRDTRIALAEPLQTFHTQSASPAQTEPYNDPLYDLQSNLAELGIARAHQRTRGAGVRIALIDTAVDTRHPDLAGRIAGTRSFLSSPAASPAASRHGTAMAGLIAAVANNHTGIVGIAPMAQLLVLEACWQLRPDADDATCNTFTLAQALAAALDTGVPVINLSIGGPSSPLLEALVRLGLARGVIFVGAAGPSSEGFPGGIPGVIMAGSLQHSAWKAQLTAPAEHVFTLRPKGEYDLESGTSVAAAQVSGAVALLISASRSRLSGEAIRSLLLHAAAEGGNVPTLDINDALAHLDEAQQHRPRISSGAP